MATITLDLIQYHSAAKPFDPADFVTITGTGFSFGDLSRPQVEAFAANHVDVIDASDDVLALTTLQYEGLGPVALTASDDVILRDWSVILNSGTIQQIGGLAAKGVDSIDAIDGRRVDRSAELGCARAFLPLAGTVRVGVGKLEWIGSMIGQGNDGSRRCRPNPVAPPPPPAPRRKGRRDAWRPLPRMSLPLAGGLGLGSESQSELVPMIRNVMGGGSWMPPEPPPPAPPRKGRRVAQRLLSIGRSTSVNAPLNSPAIAALSTALHRTYREQ